MIRNQKDSYVEENLRSFRRVPYTQNWITLNTNLKTWFIVINLFGGIVGVLQGFCVVFWHLYCVALIGASNLNKQTKVKVEGIERPNETIKS